MISTAWHGLASSFLRTAGPHEVYGRLAGHSARRLTWRLRRPQRSLQRSRTVGAIAGTGASAAEALSSMTQDWFLDVPGEHLDVGSCLERLHTWA